MPISSKNTKAMSDETLVQRTFAFLGRSTYSPLDVETVRREVSDRLNRGRLAINTLDAQKKEVDNTLDIPDCPAITSSHDECEGF
jgi:hypothetical protein